MPLCSECSKKGFKHLDPTWHEILQRMIRRCRGICAAQYAIGVPDVFRVVGSKDIYFYMSIHNVVIHILYIYDNDGSPCVLVMVVFCGIHVINSNLEYCLQWYLHSYFGL